MSVATTTERSGRYPFHALDAGALGRGDDQAAHLRALVRELGSSIARDEFEDLGEPVVRERSARSEPLPVRGNLKVIAVASGKGGVGKTNIAVNLCVALAKWGLRATLLDADLGAANADLLCGVTPVARLEHVIHPAPTIDAGHRHVREILMDAPGGFRLVPGSAGVARMADLGPEERKLLLASINHLAADSDVLVIDTAAGVGPCVTSFMETADLSLVIATPEPTSIADAYSLVKCLVARRSVGDTAPAPRHSHPVLGLIVNQVVDAKEARAVHARIAGTCLKFLGVALPLTGWILHDIHVSEAVRARKPLLMHDPICQASRDLERVFKAVAQHIGLNPVYPPPLVPPGLDSVQAKGPIMCAGRARRRGLRGLFRRQLPN